MKIEVICDSNNKNLNDFNMNYQKNKLVIIIPQCFFSNIKEQQEKMALVVMNAIYIHGGNRKELKKFFEEKNIEIEFFIMKNFLLTATNKPSSVKLFEKKLKELDLSYKDYAIKQTIDCKYSFKNFVVGLNINQNDKEELLILYKKIKEIQENRNFGLKIKIFNNGLHIKGSIFQLLCASYLFTLDSNIYYNFKTENLTINKDKNKEIKEKSLYPDILFKYNKELFICDAKCYSHTENINIHKEFFYTILTNNNNINAYGIAFVPAKENEDLISLVEIQRLLEHSFYIYKINFRKLNNNEVLSELIAEDIIKINKLIKEDKYTESGKIKEFNINSNIENWINL